MYRIAICDDILTDSQYISALLSQWSDKTGILIQSDTFPSAEAFLFHYEDQKDYDILLLDIEMNDMDGVTLAKMIRRENESVQIVFITGYSEYISEGYEVSALHYLMKPVREEKLFEVLNRAVEKLKKNERLLTLEASGEIIRVPFYEIRFLDVHHNYVTVHGKQDYTVKKTLGEFETELDERFFRVGRGCIVNLTFIQRVTRTEITLSDGTILPLPRGMYEPLNRAIISRM